MGRFRRGLTGNQLKILAMIAMTLDHVGLELLPGVPLLRVVGRLAFPIYGWMIAEGCRHTHSPRGYLLRLGTLAAVCQIVYFLAMGSLYQCVLVTFTLSAGLIFALHWARCRGGMVAWVLLAMGVLLLAKYLPIWFPYRGLGLDYGPWGIALPLFVFLGRSAGERLALLTLALVGLGWDYGGIQWFGLAAVPLLWRYNGQRGQKSLGRLFYLYYPAHLVAIYALGLIM